jgi:hypothetical protein
MLHVNQLHLQFALGGKTLASRPFLPFRSVPLQEHFPIVKGKAAKDPTARGFRRFFLGPRAGFTKYLAHFEPTLRANHHFLPSNESGTFLGLELPQKAHGAVSDEVDGGHPWLPAPYG